MTLRDLIERLEKEKDHPVRYGFEGWHSWRGSYELLAFKPVENTTVGRMLVSAKSALGGTLFGYKGGEFVVDEDREVYLTNDYREWRNDDQFTFRHLELMLMVRE